MDIHKILRSGMVELNIVFTSTGRGGCGYVAQAMHRVLSELNVEVKVVLLGKEYPSWGGFTKNQVDEAIEAHDVKDINEYFDKVLDGHGGCAGMPFNQHLGVVVDGILYDDKGAIDWAIISGGVNPQALAKLLKTNCWNKQFGFCNDHIKDIPGEMYAQVDNQFS